MNSLKLKSLNTYVYIDSSNIKNALKVSGIELDFLKLFKYFIKKYPNLKEVKYFEGIDSEDKEKFKQFKNLEAIGYKVLKLERKSYENPAKYKTFRCLKCSQKNKVEILKKSKSLKSNIDVYLCSELMGDLLTTKNPAHAVILTCDGDFSEMIKNTLQINKKVHITVLGTPFTNKNNYLSVRLKQLENIDRYYLGNIMNIKDRIK